MAATGHPPRGEAIPGASRAADRFLDPAASQSARDATASAYAGGALGEHLGWLFQAPWAIGVPLLLLAQRVVPRWFAAIGAISALVWVPLIVLEPYVDALSGDAVSALAFAVYTLWFLWLGALGVLLLARSRGRGPSSPSTA